MSSKSRRIYVGMTNSLFSRVMQHKEGKVESFTKRYKIKPAGVLRTVSICEQLHRQGKGG
jgi:predicted GIY-YIG superfamily endonuclease